MGTEFLFGMMEKFHSGDETTYNIGKVLNASELDT